MNKLKKILATSCATFFIAIYSAVGQGAEQGSAKVEGQLLIVESGDYTVEFRPGYAWTFGRVYFRDKAIISATGANQTVINVSRSADDPEQDPWIGTGHGKEVIHSLQLEVDGQLLTLDESIEAQSGQIFRILKESDLGPYRLQSAVTVSAMGVEQDMVVEVTADTSDVNYMYAFMHCFNAFMSDWVANIGDKEQVSGEFLGDGSMTLRRDIRLLAVYSEPEQVGAVLVYPEIYKGKAPRFNQLWNRPIDNKHYLCVDPPSSLGSHIRLRATLEGFSASPADWEHVASERVASNVKKYFFGDDSIGQYRGSDPVMIDASTGVLRFERAAGLDNVSQSFEYSHNLESWTPYLAQAQRVDTNGSGSEIFELALPELEAKAVFWRIKIAL